MILESMVRALLILIESGKITPDDIKNADYKTEILSRLSK